MSCLCRTFFIFTNRNKLKPAILIMITIDCSLMSLKLIIISIISKNLCALCISKNKYKK